MTERQLHHQQIESEPTVIGSNEPFELGRRDRHPELDGWLLQRDITVHDFPYIERLLQTAYADWREDAPTDSFTVQGDIALYDYTGKWIAGDGELQHHDDARQAAELSLRDRRIVMCEGSGSRCYVACPLKSRLGQDCFAVAVCRLNKPSADGAEALFELWVHTLRTQFYRRFEYMFIEELIYTQREVERESKRRDVLYHVIRHMHDRIDVDAVLSQIMESVELLVPEAGIEVYLSQDHSSVNPQVKTLLFKPWSDPIVMEAFMKGEVCYRRSDTGERTEVAFALCGKQGSYGVLKISLPMESPDPSDIQLIQLIVETAGTAFENARLHEQSNEVIQELRFINDLTKRINQSLRLRDVFRDATHELLRVFKAEFCVLLQLNDDKKRFEVVSCNLDEFDGAHFPSDEGLFGYMHSMRDSVIVSDSREQSPTRMHFFEKLGLHSVIAAPLFGSGEMVGIVVLADKRPQFFTYDNLKLLQMLATHIGLAIANATLHARVKHLANKDQLTGLYARHYLDKQIDRQQKSDFCGSLIIVDIDYFKQINDTYGHQTGDKILNQVSQIIRSSIRETDIAARWGGEEIAIYLPQLNVSQTIRVAERIRSRVANETNPQVTVSCGIAEWNWQDEKISVESLFYRADMALYQAKNSGRNQIRISNSYA
ncbi:sensor domain-containing diguanylate cyclase [Paenibacillus apiarius]|uniref:sensor domain-containing diguanylate cyclase n=1 Tax=Paenibacillus apiarius TaxID=46240 RepID=UPI00197EEB72|nr:sensor domain-containing diguanylate cyclase [Paenibacillus apiarius]MBN3526043.1 GGDEF domain-containing protein [Paenibacillus apiarius]